MSMAKKSGNKKECPKKNKDDGVVGYIYIFTNPSFPQWVKIGYADDVDARLTQANASTYVPFAFRCYGVYGVTEKLEDKVLHKMIDQLNPALRSIEQLGTRQRVREFYKMDAEDAYNILETVAKLSGTLNRLRKTDISDEQLKEETEALSAVEEYSAKEQMRAENFSFDKCKIDTGELIEYYLDSSIKAEVIGNKKVKYNGREYSLSSLAKELSSYNGSCRGPAFFKYNGKLLSEIMQDYLDNESENDLENDLENELQQTESACNTTQSSTETANLVKCDSSQNNDETVKDTECYSSES